MATVVFSLLKRVRVLGCILMGAAIRPLFRYISESFPFRYEEKAAKDLERYDRQTKKAVEQKMPRSTKDTDKRQKLRLKASLSNQQNLDKMFHSQTEKKQKSSEPVKIVQVPFSMNSFKHKLQRHEESNLDKHELYLIRRLSFPDVWIMASEKNIMLLNPYRVEEALLYKKLLMNHKLPVETLDKPIALTDRYCRMVQGF